MGKIPFKTTVHFNIPNTNVRVSKKILDASASPEKILQNAYSEFKIRSSIPFNRCRLLVYKGSGLRSIDKKKDKYFCETLLEVREEGVEFEICGIEDFNVKVYQLSWNKSVALDVDGPFDIRTNDKKSILESKNSIAKKCHVEDKAIQLAIVEGEGVDETCILHNQTSVEYTDLKNRAKVFMTTDQNVERFKQTVAEEATNIWTLHFSLTKKQVETLRLKSQETEDNSNKISCHGNDESRFFKATYYDKIEDFTDIQDIWKVLVDCRMTIGKFIANIQPFIPVKNLGLHKKFDLNLELEKIFKDEKDLIDTFDTVFEFGRVLSEEEFVVNLYYLNLDEFNDFENRQFICRYIFKENSSAGETKKEIIEYIRGRDKKYEDMTFESTRLREGASEFIISYPRKIIIDDKRIKKEEYPFRRLMFSSYKEGIYIQHLKSSNQTNMLDDLGNQLSDNCNPTLVRKFSPSTKELGKYQEIVVNEISDLKDLLSKLSGIPKKNMEMGAILVTPEYYYVEDQINDIKNGDSTWFYSINSFLMKKFSGESNFNGYAIIYKDNTERRPSLAASFFSQSIKWFSRLWNVKIISNKKNLPPVSLTRTNFDEIV